MSLAELLSWRNMKLIVRIFELCGWMTVIPAILAILAIPKHFSIRNEFWYRIWYRKTKMVSRYQKVRDTCDTKSLRNGLMGRFILQKIMDQPTRADQFHSFGLNLLYIIGPETWCEIQSIYTTWYRPPCFAAFHDTLNNVTRNWSGQCCKTRWSRKKLFQHQKVHVFEEVESIEYSMNSGYYTLKLSLTL